MQVPQVKTIHPKEVYKNSALTVLLWNVIEKKLRHRIFSLWISLWTAFLQNTRRLLLALHNKLIIFLNCFIIQILLFVQISLMNCFCGMVDRRKAFSLISSRDHCQRSSPSQISNTPRAGFKPAQSLSSGLVEWSCAVMITTTPRRHNYVHIIPYYKKHFLACIKVACGVQMWTKHFVKIVTSFVTVFLLKMTLCLCLLYIYKKPIILSLFKIGTLNFLANLVCPLNTSVRLHNLISINIFLTTKNHGFSLLL